MFNLFKSQPVVDPNLPMIIPQPAVIEPKEEIIDLGTPLEACLMITCKGCTKLVKEDCSVYARPHKLMWHRQGHHCPFNPEAVETKKSKQLNPIKASKRGR